MYGRWTLDCIIEAVQAVAFDFVDRPRHYGRVPDDVAAVLERFRSQNGHRPDWPDLTQRTAVFSALLGPSDAAPSGDRTGQFHMASAAVRSAASAFAERAYDTGLTMLRQRFRDGLITLRAYLASLSGQVVTVGDQQTQATFARACAVLANTEVAAVFGLAPAANQGWPLEGTFNGDGAYLIEEITRVLQPASIGSLSERQFLVLQRVAAYGRSTIAGALDASKGWDKDDRIDAVIQSAYSWMAALRDLDRQP
jgi:hypothetical protein